LFYKAANNVFGKIARIASEEGTLQLVKSKCITILLYGLEVCELNKSQMAAQPSLLIRGLMRWDCPSVCLSVHLSVCLSVCRQNAYTKTRFSQKLKQTQSKDV